jgi:hypothetical protein
VTGKAKKTDLGGTVGDLLADFILGLNSRIDESMNSTAFLDKEQEFRELSEIGGEIIADKIELTPERLLVIRFAALYSTCYVGARSQKKLNKVNSEEE